MHGLSAIFEKYPEMGVYLAVGLGYLIGKLKYRGAGLGVVTGSLLSGIFIGNFFHVPVSDQAKALLFLLFLFGIGYSVGPSFFRGLKGDGWKWALLGIVVPLVGLVTAYTVARVLKLDPGFAGGLLSGALTESPALGTAIEALKNLSIDEEQKQLWISHVAVADAICYIFGTIGVIWVCGTLGPKLLRIDLREESRNLESSLGIKRSKLGVTSAWQPVAVRAYRVPANAPAIGKTIEEIERDAKGGRLFIERIRHNGEILAASSVATLEEGDTIAVFGRTDAMVQAFGSSGSEVVDSELLDIPVAAFDVYVTSKAVIGKSLTQIVNEIPETRGILLRAITRAGNSIPVGTQTILERGDMLHLSGAETAIEKFSPIAGKLVKPSDESDLSVMSLTIFLGVLIGAAIVFPVGKLHISLGTSVGTLLVGLIVGWLRSVRPVLGNIPDSAILLMRSLGLAAFVAMIGLKAGPIFIVTVKQQGYLLFLGGIVVTLVPLVTGLYFGKYVLKVNPVLLLGGLAGAQTMIAGVAAVQEKSDSAVATLGYSSTAAFGHILLTTSGTIIIALLT